MGILASQLRLYVIRPTLQKLNLWSQSAENLLLGTAAQESHLGTYLKQENGPALGIYQIEPFTHADIRARYLLQSENAELRNIILGFVCSENAATPNNELITNLAYSTAICRCRYLEVKENLPNADDAIELGRYWKKYYNTPEGAGTIDEFVSNYHNLIGNN